MKRNTVMVRDEINTKKVEAREIVNKAKTEQRELTDEEQGRVDELKEEIKNLNDELEQLEEKAKRTEEDNPNNEENVPTDENKEENKRMKHNFSILAAIRSVVDNKPFDPVAQAMVEGGKKAMRGMNISGQIQIPVEKRTVTVTGEAGEHDDVISTDMMNVLEPLQHKMALAEAGVKFLTGLVGDVQYPVMSNGAAEWEGETSEADDLGVEFTNVKLQPKRLSATIEVSKQFIMQDSVGAENAIRNELVNAIAQKLEGTILGTAAGTTTKPAGIFYNCAETVSDFAGICEKEADLEANKFIGEKKYIVSPSAKAAMRGMIKGTNGTGMVFENGEVDGTPAISTGFLTGKQVAVGQWDQYVIGQWGALDITVDPYTKAKNACVVLTINAWFDAKPLREGAIKCYTITGGDTPIS